MQAPLCCRVQSPSVLPLYPHLDNGRTWVLPSAACVIPFPEFPRLTSGMGFCGVFSGCSLIIEPPKTFSREGFCGLLSV